MNQRQEDFMRKLADLLEEYNAGFGYTQDDDGIHISMNNEDIFVGFISEGAPEIRRELVLSCSDYRVECKNTDCSWSGLNSESFCFLCPKCGDLTEPDDRDC